MPTVFAERAGISLYDVQHPKNTCDKIAIPESTIQDVLKCMLRFKDICHTYEVSDENVVIVATEATRYRPLNAFMEFT
jgi:retrograde regulation protein 2